MLEVELPFPRRAKTYGPMGLVQDDDNHASIAKELSAGDPLELETFR